MQFFHKLPLKWKKKEKQNDHVLLSFPVKLSLKYDTAPLFTVTTHATITHTVSHAILIRLHLLNHNPVGSLWLIRSGAGSRNSPESWGFGESL